jgi:hypothetical protein
MVANSDLSLAVQNVVWGPKTKSKIHFISEYATWQPTLAKQLVSKLGYRPAAYMLDSHTEVYSDYVPPSKKPELKKEIKDLGSGVVAIESNGVYYLRIFLELLDEINKAFFTFQRFRDGRKERGSAKAVVAAMQSALVKAQAFTPVLFWPMDLESCFIGSHHGAVIYEELVTEMLRTNIPLCGPNEAYDLLTPKATPSPTPHRRMSDKWEGVHSQRTLRDEIQIMLTLGRTKNSVRESKLKLLGAYSDGFVVKKFQHTPRVTLDADKGPLTFGGEHVDIVRVQEAALDHFMYGKPFGDTISQLAHKHQDSVVLQRVRDWWVKK